MNGMLRKFAPALALAALTLVALVLAGKVNGYYVFVLANVALLVAVGVGLAVGVGDGVP